MTIIPPAHILPGVQFPDKKKIIQEVANAYNLPVEALYEHTRKRTISEPRMVAIAVLKISIDVSNFDLGEEFGITGATVVHARKTVKNLYLINKSFRVKFDSILAGLFIWESDRQMISQSIINLDFNVLKTFEK